VLIDRALEGDYSVATVAVLDLGGQGFEGISDAITVDGRGDKPKGRSIHANLCLFRTAPLQYVGQLRPLPGRCLLELNARYRRRARHSRQPLPRLR
jgi:hypothetical protein